MLSFVFHQCTLRAHGFLIQDTLAIFAVFFGGFVGRAIIDSIGAAGALGVGTGMRLVIALSWLFVPGKPGAPKATKPVSA